MKPTYLLAVLFLAANVSASPTSANGKLAPTKDVKEVPTFVSRLPRCQGNDPQSWNACVGAFVFPNKNSYYGEWRNGERDGIGQLKVMAKGQSKPAFIGSDMPAIYVGQFQRGQLNGHGVWIDQNGDRYEGEFKDNLLVFEKKDGVTVFGDDSDKFKKKCESYGLKFGTGEFAQCMLKLEQMANQNQQKDADREHQKEVQRISKEPTSIDWFRLASEFAKPPQFMPEPCDGGMLLPPGQRSNCR
jgi:hypothetical protein